MLHLTKNFLQKKLQLDVAVVDKFTGTMIYQYIIQYGWNRGVSDHGRSPTKNAQEILCDEIYDHDSSGYPICNGEGKL